MVYHYSKFINLMENFGIAQKATEKSFNSQNSAMNENKRYLDSIQGRMGTLSATFEAFWSKSISSDSLKTVISLLDGLLKLLNNLWVTLGILGGVLLVFNYQRLGAFIAGLWSSVTALFAVRNATQGATIAMTGLQRALGVIGLVLTAVSVFFSFSNAINDANDSILNSVEAFRMQKEQVDSLIASYKQNAELAKTDQSAKEQLILIEAQLSEKLNDTTNKLDLQNKGIKENVKAIKELQAEQAKDIIMKNKVKAELAETEKNNTTWAWGVQGIGITPIEQRMTRAQALEKLKPRLAELNNKANKSAQEIDESLQIIAKITSLEQQLSDLDKEIKIVADAEKSLANATSETTEKTEEQKKSTFNLESDLSKLEKSQKSLEDSTTSLSSAYKELNDDGTISTKTALELIDTYPSLISQMQFENGQVKLNKKALEELWEVEKKKHIENLRRSKERIAIQQEETRLILEEYKKQVIAMNALIGIGSPSTILLNTISNPTDPLGVNSNPQVKMYQDKLKSGNEAMKKIQAQIDAYSKTTLDGISADKKSKKSTSEKQKIKDDIDAYIKLNNAISEVNNTIERNKNQMEQYEGTNRIFYLEKEIKLLNEKREALIKLKDAQTKEKDSLFAQLKSSGLVDENGEIKDDYLTVFANKRKTIDAIPQNSDESKKEFEKQSDAYEDLEKKFLRYKDLLKTEIPKLKTEIESIDIQKSGNKKTISTLNTENAKSIEQKAFNKTLETSQEHYEKINLAMQKSQSKMATLVKYSEEYNKELTYQNKLRTSEQDELSKTNDALREQLKTTQDLKLIKEINKEIDQNSAKWWDIQFEKIKQAQDLAREQIELEKQKKEAVIETIQEQLNSEDRTKSIEFDKKEKKLKEDVAQLDKNIFFVSKKQFDDYQQMKISQLETDLKTLKTKEQTSDVLNEISAKEKLLSLERKTQYENITDFKSLYQDINQLEEDKLKTQIDEIEKQGQYYTIQEKDLILQKIKLDLQENKITLFDDELNRLQALDKLKDKDLERLQKQIDLEKQKQRVANVEKERNVKMLVDGKWKFVANPETVKEEKEKLLEMEIDYSRYTRDAEYETNKESIQATIDKKNDILKIREDTYNRESDILDKTLQKEKDAWEDSKKVRQNAIDDLKISVDKSYEDMEALATIRLTQVQSIVGTNWDNITSYLSKGMLTLKIQSESILAEFARYAATISNETAKVTGTATSGMDIIGTTYKGSSNSDFRIGSNGVFYDAKLDYSAILNNKSSNIPKDEFNKNVDARNAKIDDMKISDAEKAKMKSQFTKYANGGLTTNTGLHWLDGTKASPELVLKPQDTENMLSIVKIARNISIPTLKTIAGINNSLNNKTSSTTNYYTNIDKVQSNDAKQLVNGLKSFTRSGSK